MLKACNCRAIVGRIAVAVACGWGHLATAAQPGSLDTTFDPGSGVDPSESVFAIAWQPDGKILIGGDFSSFNGTSRKGIARVLSGGGLDGSFDPGTGTDDLVNAIGLQGANVIIGGYFGLVNGVTQNYIARLQSGGALDAPYHAGTGADGPVLAIAVASDGKAVVGGLFTEIGGASRNNIARLHPNGTNDFSFDPGTGVTGEISANVNTLVLQNDGKVVLGGAFSQVNGVGRTNLARLQANGNLDLTFNTVVGTAGAGLLAGVYTVAVQTDGKIVLGGDFTSINGTPRTNLARVTSLGVLDPGFNVGIPPNAAVNSVAVQSNGKIIIGGFFTQVSGTNRAYVARLNVDGSLDGSFDSGQGADDAVYVTALQPDGQVLIGGLFGSYGGTSRRGIARLHGDAVLSPPQLLFPTWSNQVFRVWTPTLNGKSYVLQFKNSLSDSNWTSLPAVAGDGSLKILTDLSATVPGRFYRATAQ
jgi:uncharacterized delta-60 repeat protein